MAIGSAKIDFTLEERESCYLGTTGSVHHTLQQLHEAESIKLTKQMGKLRPKTFMPEVIQNVLSPLPKLKFVIPKTFISSICPHNKNKMTFIYKIVRFSNGCILSLVFGMLMVN